MHDAANSIIIRQFFQTNSKRRSQRNHVFFHLYQIACMSINSKKTQLWSFFSFLFSAMHYVTHFSIGSTNCELKIFPLLNQIACMSISSQKPHSRFSCGFGVKCAHIHECVSISAQSKGEVGGDVQQGFWQPLLVGSRSDNGFAVSNFETEYRRYPIWCYSPI